MSLNVCLAAFSCVYLSAAVFDNEGSKLLVVQPLRLDSDDRAHPLEPVPGCWFCLKEGYAALYHPRGSALWALLDGTAVEGDRRHNLVRVLVSDISCMLVVHVHGTGYCSASCDLLDCQHLCSTQAESSER